jgi:hypothetical protein
LCTRADRLSPHAGCPIHRCGKPLRMCIVLNAGDRSEECDARGPHGSCGARWIAIPAASGCNRG